MERAQPEGYPCQSCGMPMEKDGDFGTEADGSRSGEFCANCYQGGKFTQPALTLEGMQELVHDFLLNQLGMS
ncbi:MAG: zinc ribbon domain-containing protein, partial [Methermicoccaceae archaeon]